MTSHVRNDGTNRTDRTREQRQDEWMENSDYVNYEDYNFDGSEVSGNYGNEVPDYGGGPAYPTSGQNPYGPGSSTPGTKNLGTGSDFPQPQNSEAYGYMQQLAQQGMSNSQIKQQMQAMYGWVPTDADIQYAKQGLGGFSGPPGQYYSYANTPQGKMMSKAYGTPGFQQYMDQQQQANEAKNMSREMRKKDQEAKVKIHMILLQIMMGDIAGALRSYAVLMDRDLRQFSRLIVKKLDGVRRARSMVIRNFARAKPPRAYAGTNPQTAARAQDKSAKYTQYVQMSTQLMNELQNTERELVDALQSQFRQLETFWQTVATFRDEVFRTNDRVMTMR
ncbi:MAG: hypothetical protein U1F66_12375 [bacterium]